MSGISAYILSVVAAAMLAAMIRELAAGGALGTLLKFLAGIFVAVTMLAPLVRLELPDPQEWILSVSTDGDIAAAAGREMADEAASEIIKSRVEAYIVDKAAAWGGGISADVFLDEAGIPVEVILYGAVSPSAKAQLGRIISQDLGIGEEMQHWAG